MTIFEDAGFQLPTDQPTVSGGDLFKAAGFTVPTGKPTVRMLGTRPLENWEITPGAVRPTQTDTASPKTFAQTIEPSNVLSALPGIGKSWWEATKEAAGAGRQEYEAGVKDIRRNLTATGIGEAGLGALQVISSPAAGALNTLGQGVTQLTGSPEIGEKAAALTGLFLPTKGTQAAVKASSEGRAINTIVKTVGAENVPALVSAVESNPRLSLMDKSDSLRVLGQGLIDPAQPEAMNAIVGNIKARMATLPSAVNSAYTEAMGPAPDTQAMLSWLKQRAQDAGQKAIQPALAKAKPVDTSPVIAAIDAQVKPGLQAMLDPATKLPLSPLQQELLRLKQQLIAPTGETLTDAGRLHQVQSALGDKAYQYQQSAEGPTRLVGGGLRDINEKLVDAIDKASGGSYRPARQQFKDAKDISQAWEEGFDVLKNRQGVTGLQDRPEALQAWMKQASPEEIEAKKLAVRSDIDQKIKAAKNQALAGQNIVAPEYNAQKLAYLFGTKEASRLVKVMDDAAAEAQTNAKVMQGSKTAETLAGQKALALPTVGGGSVLNWAGGPLAELAGQQFLGLPGAGAAVFGAAKGAQLGTQLAARGLARARNTEFAKAISSTGPARDETISALLSHPAVVREMKKSGNALSAPFSP